MKKIFIFILLLLTSCQNNNNLEEKIVTDTDKTSKTILALGDSLTAGYNLDLSDSYPMQLEKILTDNNYNYKVINAGVSGNTSAQLLERLDLYLSNPDNIPQIAILVIGGNDGLRSTDIKIITENIETIIQKLKEKNIKVVLAGMKIPPNLGLFYSNDFYNQYKQISKKTDVYLIDFFLEGVAGDASLNIGDGLHPNKKGYSIIAKNVFDFLVNNKLIKND